MLRFHPDLLPSVGPALELGDAQCCRAGERHRGARQKQDGETPSCLEIKVEDVAKREGLAYCNGHQHC